MNATTLLRTSFAALAIVAAGLSDATAQQPRSRGHVRITNPTAKAPAFAPRSTIPGSASTVPPAAGQSERPIAGVPSAWTSAVAHRPTLLIDPHLSSYETWAQFDGPRESDPSRGASVRYREPGQALNQFSHRDGVDYR